jgi:ABC-2 type transport system ATP-binding protein
MKPVIEFTGVKRWFDGRSVLRGLDLTVAPGEAVALLGRNGAGKSTALKILLGFLEPHAGSCRVFSEDSRRLRPETRERIGYVAEDPSALRLARIPWLLDFEEATRANFDRAFAEKAIAKLDLRTKVSVQKLSRGQRASLALILATASKPSVLVFDDPALGLDVVARRELLETLIDEIAERDVALLFSSHILTDVERLATRVAILRDGVIVAAAPVDELRRRVTKRVMRPKPGVATNGSLRREFPAILRARRRGSDLELTLLDLDEGQETRLRERADLLTDAQTLDLEELFTELTASDAHPKGAES